MVAFANQEGNGLCGMRVAVGLCEKLDTRVCGVSVPTQQEGRWPTLQANPRTLKEREVTGKTRAHGQPGLFEAHIQKTSTSMDPNYAQPPLEWLSAWPMGLHKSKHDTWVSTGNHSNHEFVINVMRELLCTRMGRWACAHAVGDSLECGLRQTRGSNLYELDQTIWEEVLEAAEPEGLLSIEYKRLVNELEGKRAELDLAYMEAYANWRELIEDPWRDPLTPEESFQATYPIPPTPHVIMLCSLLEAGFGWMHPFYLVMVMREWYDRVMKCEPPSEVSLALAETHFGVELYNDDWITQTTNHVMTWVSMLNHQGPQLLLDPHHFAQLMKAMYHRRVPHINPTGGESGGWPITVDSGESLGSVIFYGGHCWVRCDVTTVTEGEGHRKKSNTVPCCPWVMPEHTGKGTGCLACGHPVFMPNPMDTSYVMGPQGPNIAHSVTATSVQPPLMLPECERLCVLGNFGYTNYEPNWGGMFGIDHHGTFTFGGSENRRNYTTFRKGCNAKVNPFPRTNGGAKFITTTINHSPSPFDWIV
jgi:hypothetical protein